MIAVAPRAALRAQGAHSRPFRGVQPAQMPRGVVRRRRAFAAEGVYFPHHMSFGRSADGGVAGHHRDAVEVQAYEQRARAHPRSGQRRLASGVSRADGYYFISVVYPHLSPFVKYKKIP
ncbi:hypothetical protein SDC9_156471 [bioreactor metagenome]|uniref:Uncharacterized protein n=1 Tax=bioreactor metagenome TaxID=1076179 RepID=A0A645F9P0_9ZZZZ